MSAVMAVDPTHYEAASQYFGVDIAGGLTRVYGVLLRDLADTGAMSGADAPGVEWGATYDTQAGSAVHAIASVQAACLKLATMLQRTGFNHASAEFYSGPLESRVDATRYDKRAPLALECAVVPPAGGGGSGDKPSGLGDVESAVGTVFDWPTGRPDRLRDAAGAWRVAGRSLGQLTGFVDSAVARIALQTSPEVADAVTVCSSVKTHLEDLTYVCRSLAGACDAQAEAIHAFQSTAHARMQVLQNAELATEVVGGLLTGVTFGVSDVVAGALNEVEAIVVGHQLEGLLSTYVTASTAAQIPMANVGTITDTIDTLLAPILAATLSSAAVAAVPAAGATVAQGALLAAEARIRAAPSGNVDLRSHEKRGGHTIKKHVGKSDAYLISRKKRRASTFPDLATAEKLTGENVSLHDVEIRSWLAGQDPTLEIEMPVPPSSGRIYLRDQGRFVDATCMITVLARDPSGGQWFVLTSFPEVSTADR